MLDIFVGEKDGMILVSQPGQPKTHSSQLFASRLLNGKPVSEQAPGRGPAYSLGRILRHCCPHHDRLFKNRHTPSELLEEAGHSADLAFLAGVWRYTFLVGKIVKMPEAFQVWPPVKNWRRHVVDQATLVVKATA